MHQSTHPNVARAREAAAARHQAAQRRINAAKIRSVASAATRG